MKNKLIFSIGILFIMASCSKSAIEDNVTSGTANVIDASAVPQAVRTAFNNDFSGATGVEWQRNSSSFTSQFNHSSQRHEAHYDDNGHQSSHSVICIDGPVPEAVLTAFRSRFSTDNVYEWKLRNDGTWRAHIMRGGIKYEATYSAAGDFIKFEQA